MTCPNCGEAVAGGLSFCESCGASIERLSVSDSSKSAVPIQREASFDESAQPVLTLRSWVIGRILFKTEYGTLTLSSDHLVPRIKPVWRALWLDVVSRFFFWGFDPASFLHTKSRHQLKNVSSAGVLSLRWIAWRWNFVWVTGPSILLFLPVSTDQLDDVSEFIQAVQNASISAKYQTTGSAK